MFQTRRIMGPMVFAILFGGSTALAGQDLAVDVQVLDDIKSCDADGVLDRGEVGRVVVAVRNLTASSMSDVVVVVESDDALELSWNKVRVPKLEAYGFAIAEFEARLRAEPEEQVMLHIEAVPNASEGLNPVTLQRSFWMHVDSAMGVSSLDDVEFAETAWSAQLDDRYGEYSGWSRGLDENSNRVWFMTGVEAGGHATLESPVLHPKYNEDFVLRFEHRHDFDAPGAAGLSGGVVELSADHGRTWRDISEYAEVAYNGKVNEHAGELEAREAFVGRNAGLPGRDSVSINLANTFQGDFVQVRFRMAVVPGVRAAGWELDNIEILGAVETPFGARVAHRELCGPLAELSGQSPRGRVYLPDDSQGDQQGFVVGVTPVQNPQVLNMDVNVAVDQSPTEPGMLETEVLAEQVFQHEAEVVVRSPLGRTYSGQVVAAGCTSHSTSPGAMPFAMVLVLLGWGFMSSKKS